MKDVFAPGCALLLYKPYLADALVSYLRKEKPDLPVHLICCHHDPRAAEPTRVVNVCAGCDRRYRSLYENVSTVSLWEVLAGSDFPFPDHSGLTLSVHDACPVRTEARVHDAVRALLARMNITVVEPPLTRESSICCGDSLFGKVPERELKEAQDRRAAEMPCEQVAVYCVSCIKSIAAGGRQPRYLVDLLFGEQTDPGDLDLARWHALLEDFIANH